MSVFEDDDEDIYNTEDMSNYDFSLPYAGEVKKSTTPRKKHTSEDCIEGFHVSLQPFKRKEVFPLPTIPEGTSLNFVIFSSQ